MSLIMKENWSVLEKKKLARLLSTYPLDAYENIAANLPNRSPDEVRDYIKKMIHSTKSYLAINKEKNATADMTKAPLETWLDVTSSLVDTEQFDYSTCLSKVMEFVSSFEEFPEGDIEGHPQPDYRMIYKYISQILEGDRREDIDELGPLESAIVLDLIHSLMEVLSDADLTVQFNIIRWKYMLLKERNQTGHPIPELLQLASENDFREFIKSHSEFDHTDGTEKEGEAAGSSTDQTADQAGLSQQESCETDSLGNKANPKKIVAHYTYEASYSASSVPKKSDPHRYLNHTVFHNKPGRKAHNLAKDSTTKVTEIVRVVPPKNAIIVNKAPRTKRRTLRNDGKYFGINIEDTCVKDEADKEIKKDILYNKNAAGGPAWESRKRKYESLMKKKDSKKEVKKDKWYSLNPFCLPISLLDLDT